MIGDYCTDAFFLESLKRVFEELELVLEGLGDLPICIMMEDNCSDAFSGWSDPCGRILGEKSDPLSHKWMITKKLIDSYFITETFNTGQ